jgi:hypothetical protein
VPIVLNAKSRAQSKTQHAGADLAWQLSKIDGLAVEREFIFHPVRKWRFDGAIVADRVAFEIEGAIFNGQKARNQLHTIAASGVSMTAADVKALMQSQGGRHNRGAGMKADLEKYAEAAAAGWIVVRVMPEWVTDGRAREWVRRAVAARRGDSHVVQESRRVPAATVPSSARNCDVRRIHQLSR